VLYNSKSTFISKRGFLSENPFFFGKNVNSMFNLGPKLWKGFNLKFCTFFDVKKGVLHLEKREFDVFSKKFGIKSRPAK
jgi:hypothetical protein